MNRHLNFTRRHFLASAAGGVAAAAVSTPLLAQQKRFAGRDVVFATFSSTRDLFQKVLGGWLQEETGATLTLQPMLEAEAYARMQAEIDNPQIDMFVSLTENEIDARTKGISQKITWLDNTRAIPGQYRDQDGFWVHWAVIAQGIIYRTDKVEAPASYLDLFRPEYAGHIMFPSITNAYGFDFFMMMAKIHGGSEDNVEPAFKALRELKESGAHIIRGTPSEVQQQFAQNDMWMLPYDTGNAHQAQQVGLPVAFATMKEGSPALRLSVFVTRNSRNGDIASAVIDRILDPEVQGQIARHLGFVPVSPDADMTGVDIVFPKPDQIVELDRAKMRANRQVWTDRFLREVAS